MKLTSRPIKNFAERFDWILFFLVAAIAAIGIINLTSVANILHKPLHNTQMMWLGLGTLFCAIPAATVDYRVYERFAEIIYGIVIVALILVLLVGTEFNNSKRWINLGFFHAQPSELMKIAMVIFLAKFFSQKDRRQPYTMRRLIPVFGAVGLPMALIMLEPDLGTALLIGLTAAIMTLFEGINKKTVLALVVILVASAPLAWMGMHDYQKNRVRTFLQLEDDPYGKDWQVKNSVIAVGAGGLWGRGYGQSTQVQKGFVPEPENDFALANWAEEYGLIGVGLLLAFYLSLILWAIRIARNARDRFGMHLSIGIAAIILLQALVNASMVVRWAPVVGITLPFVSYGGSSMLMMMICIGILMNVSIRRYIHQN